MVFGQEPVESKTHFPKVEVPLGSYREIVAFNKVYLSKLRDEFSEHGDRLAGGALLLPGSHGRFENRTHSPDAKSSLYEIIAILPEGVSPDEYIATVQDVFTEVGGIKVVGIETKGPSSTLSFYHDSARSVQPGRVADSAALYDPTGKMVEDTKVRQGNEIIDLPSRTILKGVDDLKRAANNALTGKNRIGGVEAVHFERDPNDTSKGVVHFYPEGNQLSFKIGPLRFIQNTFLLEAVRYTRQENDPRLISRLQTSIGERAQQLSDDRMLSISRKEVEEVMEHYWYFLALYHRSEKAYSDEGITALTYDAIEVEKRIAAVTQIMGKMKIRKPVS